MSSRRRQSFSDYLFRTHGADQCRLVLLNTDENVDEKRQLGHRFDV